MQQQRYVKSDKEKWEDGVTKAATDGDVDQLKTFLDQGEDIIHIDTPLRGGMNLLMCACLAAKPAVVKYLIDKGAQVNMDVDSQTALMFACKSSEPSDKVTEVVKVLLEAGALVNISSIYGDTPLMFAAQNGHTDVVELIVKQASLDATSNQSGNSAIFYAIEKNYKDIVKILLDNGASINIPNRKGFLPRAVAEIHGFVDILQLFPKTEEKFSIPSHYMTRSHYRDMVPGILRPTDVPAYFHRIDPMLTGMDALLLLEQFAKMKVSLPQFLSMSRSRLADVGVELPFMQQKVLQGLFEFHQQPWSKKSIPKPKSTQIDTFELYAMLAGDLEHFAVMRSGLIFLLNFDHDHDWPFPDQKQVKHTMLLLKNFRQQLAELNTFVCSIKEKNPAERVGDVTVEKIKRLQKKRRGLPVVVLKYSLTVGVICFLGIVIKQKLIRN